MGTVFFLMMLSSFIFLNTQSLNTSPKCSTEGPDIVSPFSLQDQNCSYPCFKLTCQKNETIIHFPSYGDLVVKSVAYDIKKLNLLDPKNCVHEVFLNLNLSGTPFDYYYILKSYTYVNCSAQLSKTFVEVPCLSGKHYLVYIVELGKVLPSFCRVVKTKGIPFPYSPHLSDNSFGLGLTWDLTGYEDYEAGEPSNSCLGKGFILIILVAAILISLKIHCSDIAWDYYFANADEVKGQDIKIHFGYEINRNKKEILSA